MNWKTDYNFTLLDISNEINESNKPAKTRFSKAMFGKEMWVPLDMLKVDNNVQRELQECHV